MTLSTFIERLKHWTATAPERDWWHLAGDQLRSKCYRCPITFVARHEADKSFAVTEYDDAAKVLGLHVHIADRIVWAADHVPSPGPNPNYEPVLRAQLLEACGVAEGGAP